MTVVIALLLILMLKWRPDWYISRVFYRWLVAKPAAWLATIERKHVLYVIFGLFLAYGFAFTAPADLAMLMAWDVVAYLDVALAVWTAAAAVRVNALSLAMKHRLSRFFQRVRSPMRNRRRRTQKRPRQEANDDDHPGLCWALQAA